MILRHSGFIATPKRIYRKFSSRIRLDGTTVQEQTRSFLEMGLGKLVKVDKTVFFYKAIPMTVEVEKLAVFRITIDQYREAIKLLDASLTCKEEQQRSIPRIGRVRKDSVILTI